MRAFLEVSVIAAAVTFGLFWLMQALITTEGELHEAGGGPTVDFVRVKRDATPEPKKRELPRKTPPKQPPPPPEMNVAKNLKPDDALGDVAPMIESNVELAEATDLSTGGADRDAIPIVRVNPQYPPHAQQRGIEGWVDLMFTISTSGSVKDVQVTAAQPYGVFEKSAVAAAKRYKYNPKVVNGEPVERTGIRLRLEFRLPR